MRSTTSDDDQLLDWVTELSGQPVEAREEYDAYVDKGARVDWEESGHGSRDLS
jgi:hypothetical protein